MCDVFLLIITTDANTGKEEGQSLLYSSYIMIHSVFKCSYMTLKCRCIIMPILRGSYVWLVTVAGSLILSSWNTENISFWSFTLYINMCLLLSVWLVYCSVGVVIWSSTAKTKLILITIYISFTLKKRSSYLL